MSVYFKYLHGFIIYDIYKKLSAGLEFENRSLMNCIDAVEGTANTIIEGLFHLFIEYNLDDTEYIRNIKAVMDSTDIFLQNNREISDNPRTLKKVLYEHAKDLWLNNLFNKIGTDNINNEQISERREYNGYYFDYIYNHGTYPL